MTLSHPLSRLLGVLCALTLLASAPRTRAALADDLVAHWPFDEIQGTKTPDVVSGFDMDLSNLTAADVVAGKVGKAFSFSNAKKTLASRVHKTGEPLPINQHPSFTIAFWAKAAGAGQADLRFFSEGNTTASDPLFNLGTHSGGSDGTLDVFIRQAGTTLVNHIRTTAEPFDDQWHHIAFVQDNGARVIYIDGKRDELEIPPKGAPRYNFNNTSIGGILRASQSHWVTGLIDEVALWKRALSEQEVATVVANGVPAGAGQKLPLEIRSFTSEFPAVAQGDKVVLRWEASKDATLAIDNGIGDVTSKSVAGAGKVEATVNANTTFTLTATRGAESVKAQASVRAVSGVAAGWRLLENFDGYPAGVIRDRGTWLNPEGAFNVVDFGANKALGYDNGNDLAALPLNSLTLTEGAKATLFFRLYVVPERTSSTIGFNLGLTDRPIRFNGDFNGNTGPFVRVEQAGDGATIDLAAHNGVGATYDLAADAIKPGSVYRVWIDVDNRSFNVVGGVQNGGDLFSVHVQKEGDASRTTLFKDFLSDRDAVNIDPALGAPGTSLTHLFLSAIGGNQGVTNVLVDDFYLSATGISSTVPVAASPFTKVELPKEIRISAATFDAVNKSVTLTWSSSAGARYTVQKSSSVTGPWIDLAAGIASAGATTSHADRSLTGAAAFYRIRLAP